MNTMDARAARPASMRARITRGILLAVAIAVAMPIAGCTADPDARYLEALEQRAPALRAAHSANDLIAKGREACDAVEAETLAELFDGHIEGDAEIVTDWAQISGAAVETLCTEYRTQFDEWIQEHK